MTDMQPEQYLFSLPGYQALSAQQQRLLLASYALRSLRLVEMFDRRYEENLSGLFCRGLSVCVSGNVSEASGLLAEIEAHIPDTDIFSEQEGAYAQNAFLALYYLLQTAVTGNPDTLSSSVEMAAQNVDLIYYERDPAFGQKTLVKAEQRVLENLLERVKTTSSITPATFEQIAALASPHGL